MSDRIEPDIDTGDSDPKRRQPASENRKPDYEAIVQRLAFAAVNEQRRSRRWRIFFFFLTFLYLTPLALLLLDASGIKVIEREIKSPGQHTALVRMEGIIASEEPASAESVIASLQDAFEDDDTVGVILEINSPGGSPVQSAYIYDEIRRLREEHEEIPLHVVVTDMAASGGYFVAAAADKIFVNRSSLIGSIGVRMDSFGLTGLIERWGIERRLYTAGEHKGMLDPFLPENPQEKERVLTMLEKVHQHFIDAVKQGRGERLKDDPQLFSGMIWSGEEGIELGLADGYGSRESVARDVIGEEEIVDFTTEELLLDRLAARIGSAFGGSIQTRLLESVRLR
jgi:protease-4